MEIQSSNINLEYCRANSGKRLANYLIDGTVYYIIIVFISFIIEMLIPYSVSEMNINRIEERLVGLVLYGLVMFLIEAAFQGKSLGKLITGTKAVKNDGGTLNMKDAFIRNFIRAIPFNALSALGTPCRPWHDSLSNTIVVDEKVLNLQLRKEKFFENLKNQRQ
ncbi:RDD family protein [Pedobacter boryungensis]|uniref:RDD family protein n=1 Tax=Pedobacter boryungensis TaxID=869962 RepID=A0ABX2DCR1_9SPHI|nr:RDD family protein [Pedobacter boryungensis]NQX31878.1 RDD family protein [Pedobacter boryungensis]